MAQAAANSAKLNGKEPSVFNGDRDKSEQFIREFDLFREMNVDHVLMTNPYKRVVTALAYMRGTAINDWVEDQLKILKEKVNRNVNPIARTEEVLWTDFFTDFETAYTDTTKRQTAYRKLHDLKMNKDDLDSFIASFKNLALRAGYDLAADATIDMFARRLNKGLLAAVLDKEATLPITFDAWIEAAKRQQQKYSLKSTMMGRGTKWPTTWSSKSNSKGSTPRRHPNDETVPMDTSAKAYKAVTEDDKKKHRAEGRCFHCSKIGHMARVCPNKKKPFDKQGKTHNRYDKQPNHKRRNPTSTSFARIAEILDSDDETDNESLYNGDPPTPDDPIDIPDLAARTAKFTDEQKSAWVQEMKNLGVDFQ